MKANRKTRTIDRHLLPIYPEYDVSVLTTDSDGKISQDDNQVLPDDIAGFDLILGRS